MDWICNFRIFGNKKYCYQCKTTKNESINKDPYPINKSLNNEYKRFNKSDRFYDWTCSKCNFLVFGNKRYCYKCNTRNPILPVNL